jgi:hypothetical protein
MPNAPAWTHVEWFTSDYGTVTKVDGGEWEGRVKMPNGQLGRIRETFVSADVAKGMVERVWEAEKEKYAAKVKS